MISGPRSVLPEPDPNSKTTAIVRLPTAPAARYWNMARQRYYRSSARCCHVPRVSPDRAARPGPHTRGKPRLLDVGKRIPARDRFAPDSEQAGFELAVPLAMVSIRSAGIGL